MSLPAHNSERASGERVLHVIQGTFEVSKDPEIVMSTILGSCVAVCLFDPDAKVGGMNHYLLAEGHGSDSVRYGVNAMELLINGMLKKGADRSRLRAKVFGGGRMMQGMFDIGADNAAFAREFLGREGIPIDGESLGGDRGRRIRFWPTSGRARQLLLGKAEAIPAEPPKSAPQPVEGSGVELF